MSNDPSTTPLYRAVLAGDVDTVRKQIAGGADVNARNADNRWTALMVAVGEGFTGVMSELLASPKIDVNARAERDLTALHVAVERGNQRAVELLLAHPGIDVNVKDHIGRTAADHRGVRGRPGARRAAARAVRTSRSTPSTKTGRPRSRGRRSAATPGSSRRCSPIPGRIPASRIARTDAPLWRSRWRPATTPLRRSCDSGWPPTPETTSSRPATITSPEPSVRRCFRSLCAPIHPNPRGRLRERFVERARDRGHQECDA